MAEIPPAPAAATSKPGYKTTEFWASLLAALAGILGQVSGILPSPWGVVLAALGTAAYTISRGLAKSGTLTGP